MPNVQFSTPTTADFGPAITVDPIPLTPQEVAGLPQTLLVGHEPDGPGDRRGRGRPECGVTIGRSARAAAPGQGSAGACG